MADLLLDILIVVTEVWAFLALIWCAAWALRFFFGVSLSGGPPRERLDRRCETCIKFRTMACPWPRTPHTCPAWRARW